MLFQAFRFKYPVRSCAYKNAALARELGHVANVRMVSNSNNNQ